MKIPGLLEINTDLSHNDITDYKILNLTFSDPHAPRVISELGLIREIRYFKALFKSELPAKNDHWNVDCDFSKRLVFIIWESLPEVNLICNDWQLVLIGKNQDFFHMLICKDSSHWVGRIDNEDELSLLID